MRPPFSPRSSGPAQGGAAGGVFGGGTFVGVSVALHALVLGGALWLGWGAPEAAGGRDGREPRAPLVAMLPPVEEAAPAEEEAFVPDLLPPVPEPELAASDALPDVDLVPELEPLDPPAPDAPGLDPVEMLRIAGQRVRPRVEPRRAPTAPALEVRPTPPDAPRAAALPAGPPAAAPGRPLRARAKPTPTWPAGLAFDRERHVGLLFYVRGDGSVSEVRVESASGLPLLDEHVRAFVARTWAFDPTEQPRWVRVGFRPGASDRPPR